MFFGKKKMKYLVMVPQTFIRRHRKQKGQVTIIAAIFVFMTLLVLAALAPAFSAATNGLVTELNGDSVSQTFARLVFPFLVIGLLISFLYYIKTAREQNYQ